MKGGAMKTVPAEDFWRMVQANELADLDCLPEGLRLDSDIVFAERPERKLLLDAYYLEEPPAKPRPAIVFVHGGGWRGGTKKHFSRQAAYLASRRGLFAVCCEYRLSGEAVFPACLHDIKCAVRWVRSKADERSIDPERVAIAGGSAGGHLAAMVATTAAVKEYEGDGHNDQPSHVNCCIPHNPALDLVDLAERRGPAESPVTDLIGASVADAPERFRDASPFHRAGGETPPMLLLHGEDDQTIPCRQSIAMHEHLLGLGTHSEVEIYPGKGHGWFNGPPDFCDVLKRMEKFLVERFDL